MLNVLDRLAHTCIWLVYNVYVIHKMRLLLIRIIMFAIRALR